MSPKDDAASRSSTPPPALPIARGNYPEWHGDRNVHFGQAGQALVHIEATSIRHSSELGIDGKMNDVDPQTWLADVLARIANHPIHNLDELLPWSWQSRDQREAA